MKEKPKYKICKDCGWSTEFDAVNEHYWWCPAQDDHTLLRRLVDKFREVYERLQGF